MSTEITLLFVYYVQRSEISGGVFLVPGGMEDFDDGGKYDDMYIMDYLEIRGILVKEFWGSTWKEIMELMENVKDKFESSGFLMSINNTAND